MKLIQARPKGFSLMEIILVVMIIGMLAALVMPRLVGMIGKARIKTTMSQLALFKTALTRFEFASGRYPSTIEGLEALIAEPATWPTQVEWERYLDSKVIPVDPWGEAYVYRESTAADADYDLFSKGPDRIEGNEDDIDNTK